MSLPYAASAVSALEAATVAGLPVVLAPIDQAFVPLREDGQRLVLAADGLYIEARAPRLYALRRIAPCDTPFGSVQPRLDLQAGPLPRALLSAFAQMALDAHPREAAALAISRDGSRYELHVPPAHGTTGCITYDDTGYADSELVFDLHSHGPFAAVFSATDDASDRSRGVPHISIVLGCCASSSSITYAARLCVGSYLLYLEGTDLMGLLQ